MGKKNVLGDSIWREGTGENREKIKDRERPDGDSIEPKKVMDSNLSSKDLLKRKDNTNRKKKRIYYRQFKVLTFYFI